MQLKVKYGDWALIAGASEGTGKEFARQVAAAGINCILIARREEPLKQLAAEIRAKYAVDCVWAVIDLSKPDAFEAIKAAVGSRHLGLFIANAGSDLNGSEFLDRNIGAWQNLIGRNVSTTVQCCHYFGGLMRERRSGGLLLVGSGACYGGGRKLAVYSASKAFELCFAESLWSELRAFNVDVLYLAMTTTDTPALRTLLAEKGQKLPPRIASPQDVARVGLAWLGRGPVYNWGQLLGLRSGWRRIRVGLVNAMSKQVFGPS